MAQQLSESGNYINYIDDTEELILDRWEYATRESIKLSFNDFFSKMYGKRYVPIKGGNNAGKLFGVVEKCFLDAKKDARFPDDDVYIIYPKDDEPFFITNLWDCVRMNKCLLLEDDMDGAKIQYGLYVPAKRYPLRNQQLVVDTDRVKRGAYIIGEETYGDGYTRIGGEDVEIYDADCYPFDSKMVKPYVVKCKSETKNYEGRPVYKVFTLDCEESLQKNFLDEVQENRINLEGHWFIGYENSMYDVKYEDGEYYADGDRVSLEDVDLGYPTEFVYMKKYTDSKSERHFIAKDLRGKWYYDSLMACQNFRIKGKPIDRFEEFVPLTEITKDYDGYDDLFISTKWVKINGVWYVSKNHLPVEEDNKETIALLEKISSGRKGNGNVFDTLKKIDKYITF